MKAIIGHASALEYLRTDAPEQHRPELLRIFSAPPADCLTDLRTVERLDLERIGIRSAPIHLMAPDSFAKRSSKRVQYHTPRRFAPRTAFILAASGIYVSAPPTCFLQLSSQLSVAELALLGCELCGTYALGGVTGESRYARRGTFAPTLPPPEKRMGTGRARRRRRRGTCSNERHPLWKRCSPSS